MGTDGQTWQSLVLWSFANAPKNRVYVTPSNAWKCEISNNSGIVTDLVIIIEINLIRNREERIATGCPRLTPSFRCSPCSSLCTVTIPTTTLCFPPLALIYCVYKSTTLSVSPAGFLSSFSSSFSCLSHFCNLGASCTSYMLLLRWYLVLLFSNSVHFSVSVYFSSMSVAFLSQHRGLPPPLPLSSLIPSIIEFGKLSMCLVFSRGAGIAQSV